MSLRGGEANTEGMSKREHRRRGPHHFKLFAFGLGLINIKPYFITKTGCGGNFRTAKSERTGRISSYDPLRIRSTAPKGGAGWGRAAPEHGSSQPNPID